MYDTYNWHLKSRNLIKVLGKLFVRLFNKNKLKL